MNRELKFRVWDKKNCCFCLIPKLSFKSSNKSRHTDGISRLTGEFYTDAFSQDYYAIGTKNKRQLDTIESFYDSHKFYEIQQYIGLKDKNGNEIYEGDILEWEGPHESIFRGIVTYSIRESRYKCKSDNHDSRPNYDLLGYNGYGCEIIGNVFENKDLLKIQYE